MKEKTKVSTAVVAELDTPNDDDSEPINSTAEFSNDEDEDFIPQDDNPDSSHVVSKQVCEMFHFIPYFVQFLIHILHKCNICVEISTIFFVLIDDFESQPLRLLLQLCMQHMLLKIEAQSISETENVYTDDSGMVHDSTISAHHSINDAYAASEDPKFNSYCQVIVTVRSQHPNVLEFMMNNKDMVKVIHDVTFDIHSNKQGLVNIPIVGTIPSSATTKPPPTKERYYPVIGSPENFIQYILHCKGTSTKSAGVVLSRVLNKHAHAFLKNDAALIHLFQFIIFTTVLSQRFDHILLSDMIVRNEKHTVQYFGVMIIRFMDICISGDWRGPKGPQSKNKLLVEHHVPIGILSEFKDVIMFKANKMLESEKT